MDRNPFIFTSTFIKVDFFFLMQIGLINCFYLIDLPGEEIKKSFIIAAVCAVGDAWLS